jgi:polyhydroxyalkanoate synthase
VIEDVGEVEDDLWGGEVLAGLDVMSLVSALARVLGHPANVAREHARLLAELVDVGLGRSDITFAERDWRFAQAAWSENPAFHRLGQAYLAWTQAMDRLVDDAELDWRTEERARFAMNLLTTAVAPTNFPLTNPAVLVRAFETGGASLVRGAANFLRDVRERRGTPRAVDAAPFRVGETVAVTPGAVVLRDEVLELLQYAPQSPTVRQRPVVIVPPQINRYWFLDMAPGRSFAEHAVQNGLQVFMVSWRNPTSEHRDWDLDTYVDSLRVAVETARAITGADSVSVVAMCAGGITSSALLGHLAETAPDLVSSVALAVTLLDFAAPTGIGMLGASAIIGAATKQSARKGYLDGHNLASLFAALRPNDLIWRYWVGNNLLGEQPSAFDLLAWNDDTTRMPAGLHADFLDIFRTNSLVRPGERKVLGTLVDLRRVACDALVIGAENDHLTPWRACFATMQHLGGDVEFVLSSSGHVQSLVNPPGNPKMRYWTGGDALDPDEWRADAWEHQGSWWERWLAWVDHRTGGMRPAPKKLGDRRHPPLEPAPGSYVRER